MSQVGTKLCIYLSIFWTFICLAKCKKCSLDGVHKPVDYNACGSYKGNYNSLQNTFASYFSLESLDYASGHQKAVPVTESEDVCGSSESSGRPSTLYGFQSEPQCLRTGELDVNRIGSGAVSHKQSHRQDGNSSWSSDHLMFRLSDGGTVTCSLNHRDVGHQVSPPSGNKPDQIVLSSCRAHLLYQTETSFSSKNLEVEKSLSSDSSPPHVNISPTKLDWGHNYLYHPSLAFLKLQNTCNESRLKIYEVFSTDSQFYPFNFSEVVLGPGEVTSISFVFLPKWLGLSSAELILQTSFGGFMVEAKGFGIESPHRLRPLVELGVSSGGWLIRKLTLSNPFDESIHLREVSAWVSVFEGSDPLVAEAICSKKNPQISNEVSYSDPKVVPSVASGESNSVAMEVRPLSNWVISPHRTESILEIDFSPDPEGHAFGAICMQLLSPIKGESDTFMIPFEMDLIKKSETATWKDTPGLLSVSIEAFGHCDASETTISVSVGNNASHLSKIIRISEVSDRKKILQIKYLEGLLLFPGAVTQVALVTFKSLDVKYYDSLLEMTDMDTSCRLQILTNDSITPILEVHCQELFGICSKQKQELPAHQPDIVDFSNKRTGFWTSYRKLPVLNKALGLAEVDESVHGNWRSESTMSGLFVLDDHELTFPTVPIGGYHEKSIAVKNPSQEAVIVQLVLNSDEIMDNCKTHQDYLQPPLLNSYIHNDSIRPSRSVFSIVDTTVTEAYMHPHGSAILGPILFYPSNRCEWRSSALLRNNLSGEEWLSLRGVGGITSLMLLEGSEIVRGLEFNINLPFPLDMSPPDITPDIASASSGCRKPLLKNLFAVNAGDFPVRVQRLRVSGTECGLDGFVVHNCQAFALEPGESVEFGILYQIDFSAAAVQRDLELILASGMLVVPMKASLPLHVLHFCRKYIFWVLVKKCCLTMILAAVLISLLFWFIMRQMEPSGSMEDLVKCEKSSIHVGRPRGKWVSLNCNQGNGKSTASTKRACLRSVRKDEAAAIASDSDVRRSSCQHVDLKQSIVAKHTDSSVEGSSEISPSSDAPKETGFSPALQSAGTFEEAEPVSLTVRTRKDKKRRLRKRKGTVSGLSAFIEVSSSQSGNSTPSSPASPLIPLSPKETCSPCLEKSQYHNSSSPFCVTGQADPTLKLKPFRPDVVACAEDYGDHPFCTQQQLVGPRKTASAGPVHLPSTSSGTGRSPHSRLAVSPHARAPGPKLQKVNQAQEQEGKEDRFTYDIWGNHFSGLHLMTTPNDPCIMLSEAVRGDSDSFFLRGPQQTLMTNCRPRSVSSPYEQG